MDRTAREEELAALHAQSFAWALACCDYRRADAEDVLRCSFLCSAPRLRSVRHRHGSVSGRWRRSRSWRGARPDEPRVLQQLDRVLELERQIKRTQVEMLLQINSSLTAAQQDQLAHIANSPVQRR